MRLRRNMNNFDRLTRFIVAILLLSIFFIGNVRGFYGVAIISISTMFLFASVTAFCPFYKSTKLSTYKNIRRFSR